MCVLQGICFDYNALRRKSRCCTVGSMPALGAGGRKFEPCHLDWFVLFGLWYGDVAQW